MRHGKRPASKLSHPARGESEPRNSATSSRTTVAGPGLELEHSPQSHCIGRSSLRSLVPSAPDECPLSACLHDRPLMADSRPSTSRHHTLTQRFPPKPKPSARWTSRHLANGEAVFRLEGGPVSLVSPKETGERKGDPRLRGRLHRLPCATRPAGRLRNSGLRPSNSARRLPPARLRCSALHRGGRRRSSTT